MLNERDLGELDKEITGHEKALQALHDEHEKNCVAYERDVQALEAIIVQKKIVRDPQYGFEENSGGGK